MPPVAAEHPSGHWRARCLIVPPSTDGSHRSAGVEQLWSSLARRGLTVVRCDGCFDAMAELARHQRERRSGRTSDPLVIVLIEPGRIAHLGAFHEAALKYAPSSVFWEFHDGASLRLTAYRPASESVRESDLALTPPPTPIVARGVTPQRAPERQPLRLTPEKDIETPPLRLAPESLDAGPREASGSLLTDDELSMLLGEGFVEGSSGGARA